ncbi:MAG: dioxygenase, partial [Calditrichaeota bacterium]|nr:dioxygenase [Calditrichota bacterium]
IKSKINDWPIELDMNWGLDHGTWSVLRHLFPDASVPVIQLSIDYYQEPEFYFNFGKLLRFLRDQNVLLIGSGNIVHNLGRMTLDDSASDWAIEFDRLIKQLIDQRDFQKLIDFKNLSDSKLAIPTAEHYLPLLYILGALDADDEIEWFNEVCMNSSISMRSFVAK